MGNGREMSGIPRIASWALAASLMPGALAGAANAGWFEDVAAANKRGDYATADRLLSPLAEKGNARAQAFLGGQYRDGRGVPKDPAEAAKWFRKAADQGLAEGQYELGGAYMSGSGVPWSPADGISWLSKAADNNTVVHKLDVIAGEMAINLLAVFYDAGSDYAEEVKWLRKGAERGNASFQRQLGTMYVHGQGIPQDYAEAVRWFRKAANQDNAMAQFNLGIAYATGDGLPKDNVQAHMWFNLAASHPYWTRDPSLEKKRREKAVAARDEVAAKMTSAQIAEAQRLAREWKPPAEAIPGAR
jgi:TPR repeat protein